jgi:16S rRNA (cytosine967-C5)-methyltransferase
MAKNAKKFDPVRAAVIEILGLIENEKLLAEEAIYRTIESRSFSALDVRFIRQLVNGTTKMKRRLDYNIKFFLSKPSEKMSKRLTSILRLGFFQLLFTDRIPDAAAVSESVNLAHYFCDTARARLVNAVMRAALRHPERVVFRDSKDDPVSYLANYYSYPDWFVLYCLNEFKYEKTEELLISMNRPPRISFRVNSLKAKLDEIIEVLDKSEIKYSPGKYLPGFFHLEEGGLPPDNELIQDGKIYIQDESAGMAVRLLNPKSGMNVLDMAAAPGGKASYAAACMRNKGMITAVDKSRPRLELMIENCTRLGVDIVNPVLADNKEFQGGPFDRVMLDTPCTGWGNAGKHSDLRWSKTVEDVNKLSKLQANMLDKGARLVKPGGVMVYSTCTIIRKENDEIVEEFLIRNQDFMLETASSFFDADIVSERGFVKTYPDKPNLGGSFAARLKKKPILKKI